MEYRWKLRDWLAVPVILFGGILVGMSIPNVDFIVSIGVWGCVIGSFVLAYLAYLQPKKDIVSLLTPLYAIIIFTDPVFNQERLIQVLYAVSLTILVIRLKRRFSSDGKGDESTSRYDNEGENDNEDFPDQVPPEHKE